MKAFFGILILLGTLATVRADDPIEPQPSRPGWNCYTIVICNCETDPKTGQEVCVITAEEFCEEQP